MDAYKPYLISNFRTGYDYEVEPWLLPRDAFKKLYNAYLYRGIINKRRGYTEFVHLAHSKTAEAYATGNGSDKTYTHTAAKKPIRAGSLTVTGPGAGAEVFTDNADGTLTGDKGGTGTVNYTSGAISVTFNAAPTGAFTCAYYFYPDLPVLGIFTFYDNVGGSELLFFDTKRTLSYDETNLNTIDISGAADIFTGTDASLVWLENWNGVSYFTNNKDRVKSYNGTPPVADVLFDTDGDGNNNVNTCELIFAFKNRLVLLRTNEGGTVYPQRARWGKQGGTDFTNDEYTDAPTVDWIIGGEFLGDKLIVFFERSIWELRYTGDYDLPFTWIKICDTEGCYAPFSLGVFSSDILSLSATSIVSCDGLEAVPVDKLIPDIALDFSQEEIGRAYAANLDELKQFWLSYPKPGSSVCDETLVLNYNDRSWSVFGLPFQCFGFFKISEDLTWDDPVIDWDSETTWDDKSMQGGYPTTMGGSHDGYVFQCNSGGQDDGEDILLDIESGRWNPFAEQGMSARLKCVDFLVNVDTDISVDVELYLDHDSTPVLTRTLECSGTGEKAWKRLDFDGVIGNFHRIRITHTASNQTIAIHAVCPWFKQGGRMI